MHETPLERYAGDVSGRALLMTLIASGLVSPEAVGLLKPIGFTKAGKPIYPMAGGDATGTLPDKIEALTAELGKLIAQREGKAGPLDPRNVLATVRQPSMAAAIGDGSSSKGSQLVRQEHPWLKATLGAQYEPGAFLTSVWQAGSKDASEQTAGKARLHDLGIGFADAPSEAGKATLGTTNAGGGYVLPNNLVDRVAKPRVGAIDWEQEITFRDGVAVRGVDQPYRTGAPSRFLAQDWGATKDNVDEVYGSYTAGLVTFARIYDVGKQYLRFSAGAAEADVMDELNKGAKLAVEFSILAGPGTGTTGSGDSTTGIVTALLATPTWLGYRSAKTGAAAINTIAGSFASAIAEMCSLMAVRARFPTVIVVDSLTYFAVITQGSDTAGFWLDPKASGGFTIDASGGLSFWGVPIRHTPNFNSFAGSTKAALAIDGAAFKAYRGMELRIEASDTAGTRWDKNLVGFRGEFELGFNADTAVHVGAAQLMTAVIP